MRAVKRRLSQSLDRVRGNSGEMPSHIDENAIADDESDHHEPEKKKTSLSWLKLPKPGRKNTQEKEAENPSGSERSSTPSPAFAEKQFAQTQIPDAQPGSRPRTPERPAVKPAKTPKNKVGKNKFSVDMIKRVEGGGVGLMNPMGRYEAFSGTPPSMLFPGHNTPTEVSEVANSPRKASASSGGGILETPTAHPSEEPIAVEGEGSGVFGNGVRPDSPEQMSTVGAACVDLSTAICTDRQGFA